MRDSRLTTVGLQGNGADDSGEERADEKSGEGESDEEEEEGEPVQGKTAVRSPHLKHVLREPLTMGALQKTRKPSKKKQTTLAPVQEVDVELPADERERIEAQIQEKVITFGKVMLSAPADKSHPEPRYQVFNARGLVDHAVSLLKSSMAVQGVNRMKGMLTMVVERGSIDETKLVRRTEPAILYSDLQAIPWTEKGLQSHPLLCGGNHRRVALGQLIEESRAELEKKKLRLEKLKDSDPQLKTVRMLMRSLNALERLLDEGTFWYAQLIYEGECRVSQQMRCVC